MIDAISQDLCWRWELTPAELFAGFHPIKSEPAKGLPLEIKPFACEKKPLGTTGFLYQVAVSDRSVCGEIIKIRKAQAELPLSGDRRSGIILFEQDYIIGALVIQGNLTNSGYKLFVHPDYRERGLAFMALVEWCWLTKRQRVLPRQGITLHSSRALLSAHRVVVERAQQSGKPVPARVLDAISSGEEARTILQEAERIEKLGPADIAAERARRARGGRHG